MRRIQFTPDLLPSDVTGVSVYNQDIRDFEFQPGAIFANIVVGDEINRASPKTQSALLECMEERQVTVDGTTYHLQPPFMVMATQNPIEMEGTYPLPEAQRDRFMARISMGYPAGHRRWICCCTTAGRSPLDDLRPVTDAATISGLIHAVRTVHASPSIAQYIVDLATATREQPGPAPRCLTPRGPPPAAGRRAHAALAGRDHVLPDDVQAMVVPVLAHRLHPTGETQMARRSTSDVLTDLIQRVRVPAPRS